MMVQKMIPYKKNKSKIKNKISLFLYFPSHFAKLNFKYNVINYFSIFENEL